MSSTLSKVVSEGFPAIGRTLFRVGGLACIVGLYSIIPAACVHWGVLKSLSAMPAILSNYLIAKDTHQLIADLWFSKLMMARLICVDDAQTQALDASHNRTLTCADATDDSNDRNLSARANLVRSYRQGFL